MKVRFSIVSEFIAELETDTALIEDKLLRVTVCYQPVQDGALGVIAGKFTVLLTAIDFADLG
jgi:hypothetical protein